MGLGKTIQAGGYTERRGNIAHELLAGIFRG